MRYPCRWFVLLTVAGGLFGPRVLANGNAGAQAQPMGPFDNLYLAASAGGEKPTGEHSTGFGLIGFNWAVPLTPPDPEAIALGMQAGGNVKVRRNDPEWNSTFGVFGRNFITQWDQQGALALLFDYRLTAFHNDVWAFRPIGGLTISSQDALGIEGVAKLNDDHDQEMVNAFNIFWTRDWNEQFGTELGVGYQFSNVNETLFRGRVAYGLSPSFDVGIGGDLNTEGNFAIGVAVSYHFGGTGRHALLHNIGGSGKGLYTPFPDSGFPELVHRTGR